MKINPGDGYRLLEVGETIQEGDEYFSESFGWRKATAFIGFPIGFPIDPTDPPDIYRRKIREATSDPITESVTAKLKSRAALGLKKYGVSLADANLSLLQLLKHAQEESMDKTCYLEAAIQLIEKEGKV